jgi:hypothetical protein
MNGVTAVHHTSAIEPSHGGGGMVRHGCETLGPNHTETPNFLDRERLLKSSLVNNHICNPPTTLVTLIVLAGKSLLAENPKSG